MRGRYFSNLPIDARRLKSQTILQWGHLLKKLFVSSFATVCCALACKERLSEGAHTAGESKLWGCRGGHGLERLCNGELSPLVQRRTDERLCRGMEIGKRPARAWTAGKSKLWGCTASNGLGRFCNGDKSSAPWRAMRLSKSIQIGKSPVRARTDELRCMGIQGCQRTWENLQWR